MNQLDVIQSLGEDVILLTRPDNWLTQRQRTASQQLSILLEEIKALKKAVTIKRLLQDKNLVAVKHWKDIDGLPEEIIEIMELPEAITTIRSDEHSYESSSQIHVWEADGYDVKTAAKLRH